MKLAALYAPRFEDEALGIFVRLRALGMKNAAVGLWMDLLQSPLNAVVDDPDDEPLQNEHRGLLIARRIVDILWDDIQRSPDLQGGLESVSIEPRRKRTRDEQAIYDAGLDAFSLINALSQACEDHLGRWIRDGFECETPRLTAVMRKAFGERRAIFERHAFLLDTGATRTDVID